jgi:hypothetical protein
VGRGACEASGCDCLGFKGARLTRGLPGDEIYMQDLITDFPHRDSSICGCMHDRRDHAVIGFKAQASSAITTAIVVVVILAVVIILGIILLSILGNIAASHMGSG